MTRIQLLERFPQASESFLRENASDTIRPSRIIPSLPKKNPAARRITQKNHENTGPSHRRVRPSQQEQPPRLPLECAAQGEETGGARAEIIFRIASPRPMDWDNPWTKAMQDCLVESGILHSDAWNQLQGRCKTEKARKEEEGMRVEIYTDR